MLAALHEEVERVRRRVVAHEDVVRVAVTRGGPERGGRKTLSYAEGALSSRYANSRQVCRVLEREPSGPEMCYNLMPATWDPNVYMPFTLSVAASAPVTLEPIPAANDYMVATAMGQWSVAGNTSGGCPNFPETWTSNPQIRLQPSVGGAIGVSVLLAIAHSELRIAHLDLSHNALFAYGTKKFGIGTWDESFFEGLL